MALDELLPEMAMPLNDGARLDPAECSSRCMRNRRDACVTGAPPPTALVASALPHTAHYTVLYMAGHLGNPPAQDDAAQRAAARGGAHLQRLLPADKRAAASRRRQPRGPPSLLPCRKSPRDPRRAQSLLSPSQPWRQVVGSLAQAPSDPTRHGDGDPRASIIASSGAIKATPWGGIPASSRLHHVHMRAAWRPHMSLDCTQSRQRPRALLTRHMSGA